MKKYDLCVKSGTYTDRNGNEKVNWENIGVMVDDGSPYILLKPYINLAGFPREEGRNHLLVSVFDHSVFDHNEQRTSRNTDKGAEFNADAQAGEEPIPF